jgi:RNA polymerase sigma-70 factor, ECF subfamily
MHSVKALLPVGSPAPAAPSDRSLLHRLRDGSDSAATQLFRRYADRVGKLARAKCSAELARLVDADDIVQSVFTSFFRAATKGHYDVPGGDELWRILLVIALNKIRAKGNFHRAAKRDLRLTAGVAELAAWAGSGRDADQSADFFLRLAIAEALERLPDAHQRMITLRIEGFDVAEIAAQTRRSKRTVERVLQEFRRDLANTLREEP